MCASAWHNITSLAFWVGFFCTRTYSCGASGWFVQRSIRAFYCEQRRTGIRTTIPSAPCPSVPSAIRKFTLVGKMFSFYSHIFASFSFAFSALRCLFLFRLFSHTLKYLALLGNITVLHHRGAAKNIFLCGLRFSNLYFCDSFLQPRGKPLWARTGILSAWSVRSAIRCWCQVRTLSMKESPTAISHATAPYLDLEVRAAIYFFISNVNTRFNCMRGT